MTSKNLKLKSALAGLALAASALSAQAEVVRLTYTNGSFVESFILDTTAPIYADASELLFSTKYDTLGGNAFIILAPGVYFGFAGNVFGAGDLSVGTNFLDGVIPGTLFDGVNFVLNVAVGDKYSTVSGGTLSVTAAPEASTWTMLLAGFAALGFAGYRRQAVKTA